MSDRDDTLARLSVMAAEARESLLAHGLDDTSDTSVAGAITDATAELDRSSRAGASCARGRDDVMRQMDLIPPPSRGSLDEARRWEARARSAIHSDIAHRAAHAGEMRAPTDEEIATHRGRWRCVTRTDDETVIARDMMTPTDARAWRDEHDAIRSRPWRWWALTREGAFDQWPVLR